jgi:polar amino acid transport system substrate-binding protein
MRLPGKCRAIRPRSLATAGFAFAAGLLAALAPSSARPLDEVTASKVLRVVVYDDNRPFSETKDGTPVGIDVDIGKALAKKLGVEAEIILRMAGEDLGDDLRANVWRGPLTGGGVGDVMLHVPVDRELAAANREAVIGNAYFDERIAVALDPKAGAHVDFSTFAKHGDGDPKIGVQLGTVSDYFLMRLNDGALIDNVRHYVKPAEGVRRFKAGETIAVMGVRSELESLLAEAGVKATFDEPATPGIVRSRWSVGTAVRENSRDLGYAIGNALTEMRQSGELAQIFAAHGVTYVSPP